MATISTTDGEAGSGELNNAATWDDFPNGRFGDFKSPAYGDQDPYGNVGTIVSYKTVKCNEICFEPYARLWALGDTHRLLTT